MMEGAARSCAEGNGNGVQGENLLPWAWGRVGDLQPRRSTKLDCARPCGTQTLTGVSLVLGRSLDLRPPKSFPG